LKSVWRRGTFAIHSSSRIPLLDNICLAAAFLVEIFSAFGGPSRVEFAFSSVFHAGIGAASHSSEKVA
jgi:hypothetical protein